MNVLSPADPMEVRSCLKAALSDPHPSYMRIGKKGEPNVHKSPPQLSIGSSVVMREGGDVALLVAGVLLPAALSAAELLSRRGISSEVVTCPTIKPLDTRLLQRVFSTRRLVATIEEHSVLGGFGGSVAEWVVDQPVNYARLLRFGTPDQFLHETCEQEQAHEKFGLTADAIATRIAKAVC
jgi:transketolase